MEVFVYQNKTGLGLPYRVVYWLDGVGGGILSWGRFMVLVWLFLLLFVKKGGSAVVKKEGKKKEKKKPHFPKY